MVRQLICLLLMIPVVYGSYSQEQESGINHTDENGMRQGYWEQKYPEGSTRYRGTFRNNRPVGEFIRYFPNGNTMAIMNFCEEGIRADTELFYEEGKLAAQGIYKDEKKDSVWKYYSYYDNHLASTETYDSGVKQGLASVYYPNGRVAESFWYENDVRNGPWMQYYDNGRLRVQAEFRDDERHGRFVFYTPGGRKEIEGEYYNNQMHGRWTYYDQSGQVVSEVKYIAGRPENEDELIEKEQEIFRQIEQMRGRIPEPDESELFAPRRY